MPIAVSCLIREEALVNRRGHDGGVRDRHRAEKSAAEGISKSDAPRCAVLACADDLDVAAEIEERRAHAARLELRRDKLARIALRHRAEFDAAALFEPRRTRRLVELELSRSRQGTRRLDFLCRRHAMHAAREAPKLQKRRERHVERSFRLLAHLLRHTQKPHRLGRERDGLARAAVQARDVASLARRAPKRIEPLKPLLRLPRRLGCTFAIDPDRHLRIHREELLTRFLCGAGSVVGSRALHLRGQASRRKRSGKKNEQKAQGKMPCALSY